MTKKEMFTKERQEPSEKYKVKPLWKVKNEAMERAVLTTKDTGLAAKLLQIGKTTLYRFLNEK
jgi:hypothetical protein